MSDLILTDDILPELTLTEAKRKESEMLNNAGQLAVRLFLFLAQGGHVVRGYDNYGDFCEQVLQMDRRTAANWRLRVRESLRKRQMTAADLLEKCNGCNSDREYVLPLIPIKTAEIVAKLPLALVTVAWEQYEASGNASVPEKQGLPHLQRIVARLLGVAATPEVDTVHPVKSNCPAAVPPAYTLPDAPAVLPPTKPTHARFLAPPDADAPAVAALVGDVDAEPVFDDGDRPDYLATSAEFDDDPNRRGWWIDFTGKDGRTECLFLPENIASEAPSR